ncbi:MAG: pyridoxamine 5'-phosphate oxidase family protein [Puniceicoccales bacterium]|jgi:general stress protein 26|nr:pyridoxamine 5'-phosphate oxidase family protein [Puniceicoccales bacterium]
MNRRTMVKMAGGAMMGLLLAQTGIGTAAEKETDAALTELYAAAHKQQVKTELVMVGTIDSDGFPQIRVMSNLRHSSQAASKLLGDTEFVTYAVTRADTEKLQHLAKNPHMSMYYQDGGQGLLLMGTGEIVTDPKTRHAVWGDFFKRMGYTDPDDSMLVVLKFTPTHGKFYYKQKQNKLTFAKSNREHAVLFGQK